MNVYRLKLASEPPPVSTKRIAGRHSSEKVLAWICQMADSFGQIPGHWAVCIYYEDNYGGGWHTDCGQEWNVTDYVTLWTELPDSPAAHEDTPHS
jgi:hypothetical protein